MDSGDELTASLADLLKNLPDPNGPKPLSNYPTTMMGVTIPFHVLSWLVVAFRLHTRIVVVREPGWDDFFVVLAAAFNFVSIFAFLSGIDAGFGQHLGYILNSIETMMFWLWLTNAAYHTTTAFIKLSLLFQYLRMFRGGIRRKACIILVVFIALWGAAYSFIAWFPCFPVSGFWNRHQTPVPKCYGFGYANINDTKLIILVFACTNMFFDVAIFSIPLTEYFRKDLRKKQILAMTALFAMGSIVVLMAILRLWSIFKHSKADGGMDFTWWYPEVLIFSCLEVDFAIMCASMPIFWPTVVASWSQIFVTKEVRVTHQLLDDDGSGDHYEMNRPSSFKSQHSQEGLTKQSSYYEFDAESARNKDVRVAQVEVRQATHRIHIDTFP
ncbi:hypothetical protein P153DRAFT_356991 [Dothidotthia symphoricarpi CBS 119687]|uniref:Rhodopsin domain-containing protein n=1 Tax=Dothidotthia symphoricarpi CBS 119687 TaxID=1392245 RepID=A0A6A6ADR5_9PLEO|nr:uncharacterized protein P153DRAFT_356991 [Dothidotthia symphoricarpi CBS 119687]KAF2129413.1 hypothetical protein P153DRAFT_356991 [Dothidotthia symphoricarpi CBS 119687]